MALIRVAQYNSTPTVVGDYQAQNAHLQAFTNQLMTQQFILDSGTDQPVIKQGTYVSHGGSLYIADADTSITGSPGDGSVYIRVSGTTSLTVEFVNDISGYTWNPVYSALTSTTYTLLPYLIVKASAVWTRYNFNPQNHNFGAVKATSVDTGQGATEVHLMNQNVRSNDSPTFANATIGGHNVDAQLDRINQDLKTTANPTFLGIITTNGPNKPVDNNDASMPSVGIGGFSYATASTTTPGVYPSITIGSGGTWVYIAKSWYESGSKLTTGRIAGGSSVQGKYQGSSGETGFVEVIAWRIA